ncbi:copper resistance protein CopC/CopD [Alcaligenaceae bacterium CGII-47]|nr:copper resistance protein CopC/CopD [Alcaligenaceae bacterium CGII-47]
MLLATASLHARSQFMRSAMGILLCGWLLVCAQMAYGHAAFVASDPVEGATLSRAPAVVSLSFNEPVGPIAFTLIPPTGERLTPGPVHSTDKNIIITLPPLTAQGSYLLSWRVVSADGHPIGGALSYALGASSSTPHTQVQQVHALRDVAIWLSRLLLYLCLITSTGAAIFRASSPGAPRQDWVRRVISVGLVLLLISLALQGLDVLDAPWRGLVHADTWRAAFDTRYAGTLGFAAMALAAAYRAQDTNRRGVLLLATIASTLLLGVALANSGHASTAPPQSLARAAVALHIIAIAAWLGALIPLARLLHANAQTLSGALARFSRWITPVVGLLLLSGATLIWLQLDAPSDLWRTDYGRVLMAKLSLVALLLALAAVNRYRYTQGALGGEPTARRGLRRMIGIEIIVAACILGLVSLWRFTPPPRSLHATDTSRTTSAIPSAPTEVILMNPKAHAMLHYQPGTPHQPGDLRITLSTRAAGSTITAQAITVNLSNPQLGIEALHREAHRLADGTWQAAIPPLPKTGRWQIGLDIRVDDFDQITVEGVLAQPE